MDFSQTISRDNTYSLKWLKYQGQDILPMWVADTEFSCAQPILDALHKRVGHGILGYTHPSQYAPANEAVKHWLKKQYNWDIELEWIVWTPGVVPAFNLACRAFCEPGDKVMVQSPNYPPMLAAPAINKMERVDIDTVEVDGRWTLDFAQLEKEAQDPKVKMFILCNPMNPVGSVLTEAELKEVARICQENDIFLCSDEIHCDLVLDQQAKHIPAGTLAGVESQTITLMAASKTFNIAGLGTSFAIIPDAKLRFQYNHAGMGLLPWANIMGLVATEAAFTECDHWHKVLLDYLRGNRDYLYQEINAIEGLRMLLPQATYLAWVDASGLNVPLPQKYFEDKGVGPSPGADFGNKQFIRLNYGCPRSHLEHAIQRIKA
ncbi:PatB family C-S lyase [Paraneptunicella aestuarii]|uniref:MalY/PatB family protein n=1 Tax=Paraneptunicella aestuarii TaxID=2831148 RepID=UPI001E58F7C1|nr:PatB family C-S lyase [Paraneptunicella aestuarii]UAA38691.1 PatB family C-S lyase [Paraneptunicella aestuarii]